MKTQKNI